MKVRNMTNTAGNKVANQFIIESGDIITFQSYEQTICNYNKSTGMLELIGDRWDYSATTRNNFKKFINDETRHIFKDKKSFLRNIQENVKIVNTMCYAK